MPDNNEREQQILAAAAAVIMHLGYDKTTMSDIADEAGVSRGTVYFYFKSKEELFEALVYHEYLKYAQTWLGHIEADPHGGTIGGYYRAVFRSVNSHPFMASIMRREWRVLGNYLRKPDNLFAWMQTSSITENFIRDLQAAGTIRPDIDPAIAVHLLELISAGQLTVGEFRSLAQSPPVEAVMEAVADMMDRYLTPEGGGNSEAGKEVIRQITTAAKAQLEQAKQLKDKSKGVTHVNR